MVNKALLEPGKLEELLKNLTIKSIKENNNNFNPIDITYDSELSDSEIDSVILKLNNINKENNILIANLLKHKRSR
ncbi:hypothetical protein CD120_10170 [Staphylococcus saprophyticus]|uniref:hypothetical protein n=1 Tax=Staphylococcus saprophyticus TaxID=29385 RepID=UPI000CD1B2BB|nr:hypothetical protein [Staphylococcus saprophyticus]PNZ68608.1 hypothetical protein CD120_10170 [Staphylococcus saprophyticus]